MGPSPRPDRVGQAWNDSGLLSFATTLRLFANGDGVPQNRHYG